MILLAPPLALDSYKPILDVLGERDETDFATIVWIVVVFGLLILIPITANAVRKRIRAREASERGFEHLGVLGGQKGLNHLEQRLLERIAEAAPRTTQVALIADQVDAFDNAVSAYMTRVMEMPWLAMEDEVALLRSVREKLGFRFIPEDRRSTNTRHLSEGQKLFVLARGKEGFRLISARILDVDDLAIYAEPFREKGQVVRFQKRTSVWAFFWSTMGAECRFKTEVIKEVTHGSSFLMLAHSDALVYNPDRKIFSTDLDVAVTTDRMTQADYGRAKPTPELFDEKPSEVLPVRLLEVSGSGCVVHSDVTLGEGDLLRFHAGAEAPEALEGRVARVVIAERGVYRCRFLRKSLEALESILEFITPRISPAAIKGKQREDTVKQT